MTTLWTTHPISQAIGLESADVLRIKNNNKVVLCHLKDCRVDFNDNDLPQESSQCKITKVLVTYEGTTEDGSFVAGRNQEFDVEGIWFMNRIALCDIASDAGYAMSAWCKLDQDRTYELYERANEEIRWQKHRRELGPNHDSEDASSGYNHDDDQSVVSVPQYGLDSDSVMSDLTDKEDDFQNFVKSLYVTEEY